MPHVLLMVGTPVSTWQWGGPKRCVVAGDGVLAGADQARDAFVGEQGDPGCVQATHAPVHHGEGPRPALRRGGDRLQGEGLQRQGALHGAQEGRQGPQALRGEPPRLFRFRTCELITPPT